MHILSTKGIDWAEVPEWANYVLLLEHRDDDGVLFKGYMEVWCTELAPLQAGVLPVSGQQLRSSFAIHNSDIPKSVLPINEHPKPQISLSGCFNDIDETAEKLLVCEKCYLSMHSVACGGISLDICSSCGAYTTVVPSVATASPFTEDLLRKEYFVPLTGSVAAIAKDIILKAVVPYIRDDNPAWLTTDNTATLFRALFEDSYGTNYTVEEALLCTAYMDPKLHALMREIENAVDKLLDTVEH